jgi:hypothetical protein
LFEVVLLKDNDAPLDGAFPFVDEYIGGSSDEII